MSKDINFNLRKAITNLKPSPIRNIANTAIGNKNIIPLWFGETDITTPKFISNSMKQALDAGHTFYTTNQGISQLVDTIANYSSKLHNTHISTSRIMITSAGMNALMIAAEALVNPDDKVICITPVWPNFMRCVEIMGGRVIEIPLIHSSEDNRWHLNILEIESHIKDAKAIYINSPNNPTGWVIDNNEQQTILSLCRKNNTWIISDEVYERIIYNANVAPSFLDISDDKDFLIVVNSFSKAWAMTGWRLGWMIVPENLINTFEKLNEFNIASPSAPAQHAGITAIQEGENFIKDMILRLQNSRDITVDYLKSSNRIMLPETNAAFYTFFKVDGITDSESFCFEILEKTGVGLAPGSAFGEGQNNWIRICYAKSTKLLYEAFSRLGSILK